MKVAIVGAGGVGGYFGARIARTSHEVAFLARGRHLAAMKSEGLRLRSHLGEAVIRGPFFSDPADVGAVDLVLVCVKSQDTQAAARALGPLIGEQTVVLTLQNGLDNADVLAAALGEGRVMAGAAFILATIDEPGVVVHVGELARIVFGERGGGLSARGEQVLAVFRDAGIDASLSPKIEETLWSKFAWIIALAGTTAAVRRPLGEIRESPACFALFRQLVEEVVAVAAAHSVSLPPSLVDDHLQVARSLPAEFGSSLRADLEAGKPMELRALHGALVRLAGEQGIPVPHCETVYAILEPWARRHERGSRGAGDEA